MDRKLKLDFVLLYDPLFRLKVDHEDQIIRMERDHEEKVLFLLRQLSGLSIIHTIIEKIMMSVC